MRLRATQSAFRETPAAVTSNGYYQPVSYWQETVEIEPGAPLERDVECDVAVIGGGFTGLSIAYELKKAAPDLDVVLLERDVVGHGASGRNGGFVMPLLGWNLVHTVKALGESRAARAYGIMYDAVAHTVALIREQGIDCDLEETGYLLLATCSARAEHVRDEADLGERLGFGYQYLDGEALRAYIRSDAFSSGCFDTNAAVVNPAKLARGLASLVRRLGVRVFEQTPIRTLEDGEPVLIQTQGGTVRARSVALAVNAYAASLGLLCRRVLPVHTYIVLTEPLSEAALEEIGWGQRRTSLETSRNFIHYMRLTADNRILFGGDDAKLFWRGRLRDHDRGAFAGLEASFRKFFPSLADVAFTHRWGGAVAVTLDMFPTFGSFGKRRNIFFAGGYSGHGVSISNYAGRIVAPHILSRFRRFAPPTHSPLPFGRLPPYIGPDPARFVGMQAYRLALHLQDRLQHA